MPTFLSGRPIRAVLWPATLAVAALPAAALLSACAARAAAPAPAIASTRAPAAKPAAAMLPARALTCQLGHPDNVDWNKEQALADLNFVSHHTLGVFLPAIPVRTSAPPDATEPPEPVNPRTRIINDPDGITADVAGPVNRLVDMWPKRVEMTLPMTTGESKLLIFTDGDEAKGNAKLFMTNARDLMTLSQRAVYFGDCTVELGKAAMARAARAGKRADGRTSRAAVAR